MPEDEDDVAARLGRIEEKLDRQGQGLAPSAFGAAQKLREAYRRSDQAARAARENGGGLSEQNAARREANR
ncbi:MAG: hypothetical protein WKF96_11945 [Solirubrobacteraceae bacterium]